MFRTLKRTILAKLNKIYFQKKYDTTVRSAYVSRKVRFGPKCQVGNNVLIGSGVEIGKCTYFNSGTLGYIIVESGTEIGSFCSIAPNVFIGPGNHPLNLLTTHPILFDNFWMEKLNINNSNIPKVRKPGEEVKTIIGNDVWIGTGVIINGGVKIGNGSVIAAGSVVTKNVPPYSIVAGVPARVIKKRFSEEAISKLDSSKDKWWNWSLEKIKDNIELFYKVDSYIEQHTSSKDER